jgi:hypothetical protein
LQSCRNRIRRKTVAGRFEKAKKYTEKYKEKLLPCKECGGTDIRIVSDRMMFLKPRDGWSVCCGEPKCDCTGVYSSVKEAVKRWNER